MSQFYYLSKRCLNVGLSRDHSRFIHAYFTRQVKHRGYPGAVSLFKEFGVAILRALTGSGDKPNWVRTAFGYPQKLLFLRDYPVEIQLRIAKIARAIRYPSLRKEQLSKVLNAVTQPYCGTSDGMDRLCQLVRLGASAYPKVKFSCKGFPLVGTQFRKVMSSSGPCPVTMAPPIRQSLELILKTVFRDLPGVEGIFFPLNVSSFFRKPETLIPDFKRLYGEPDESLCVGQIHGLQEGAGKFRMFASPFTAFQLALTPLYEFLKEQRGLIPSDCTGNQQMGATWAQEKLVQGKVIGTADLATATCRYPLEPQLQVLEDSEVPKVWIDCFKRVCRGAWSVSQDLIEQLKNGFPRRLTWVVGQPLGIRPSAASFGLNHNYLLTGLCLEQGLDIFDSFRVLTDDVVMVEELYAPYLQVMKDAGVPISWSKCHLSSEFAEFAGFSITKGTMVRPGQWRVATVRNFLGLAEAIGPLPGEMPERFVEAQRLLLFIRGVYSPPVERWPQFLRAAVLLSEYDLTLPPPVGKTLWINGFKAECQRQFSHSVKFYRGGPIIKDIYEWMKDDPILFAPKVETEENWLDFKAMEEKKYRSDRYSPYLDCQDHQLISFAGFPLSPDWMFHKAWYAICNLQLEVPLAQLTAWLDRLLLEVTKQYWMPPSGGSRYSGAYIKRIMSLMT